MDKKKLGQFEMPPNWPMADECLIEMGRLIVMGGTLEHTVNLYIAKLMGFGDWDFRPAIATAHANFKQKLDILGSLCEQLQDENPPDDRPSLKGYEAVMKQLKAASDGRNKFVHGVLTFDQYTQKYKLSRMSARGKVQIFLEDVHLNDIRQVSKKIHAAVLALHNLISGTKHLTIWGEQP